MIKCFFQPSVRGIRIDTVIMMSERAKKLRRDQTDTERKLWHILRGRRLGGFKFRRQVQIDRYIVDFACHECKLVIELDGGQHNEPSAIKYDKNRTEIIKSYGYNMLRFWNSELLSHPDTVIDLIYSALTEANFPFNDMDASYRGL